MVDDLTRWRRTADLDARAGAPVGAALNEAADEVERLREQLHLANVDATNTTAELTEAEAVVDRVWAVYRARYENAQTGSETWADFVRNLGGELHSALTTTESEDR